MTRLAVSDFRSTFFNVVIHDRLAFRAMSFCAKHHRLLPGE